jgi:hypothetical protein
VGKGCSGAARNTGDAGATIGAFCKSVGAFGQRLLIGLAVGYRHQDHGVSDLERNLVALKGACAEFAPALSIRDCVGAVDSNKPSRDPVTTAREQLRVLKTFIESTGSPAFWDRKRRK